MLAWPQNSVKNESSGDNIYQKLPEVHVCSWFESLCWKQNGKVWESQRTNRAHTSSCCCHCVQIREELPRERERWVNSLNIVDLWLSTPWRALRYFLGTLHVQCCPWSFGTSLIKQKSIYIHLRPRDENLPRIKLSYFRLILAPKLPIRHISRQPATILHLFNNHLMSTSDPSYTVFIRLPFPRGDFIDPPFVRSLGNLGKIY